MCILSRCKVNVNIAKFSNLNKASDVQSQEQVQIITQVNKLKYDT